MRRNARIPEKVDPVWSHDYYMQEYVVPTAESMRAADVAECDIEKWIIHTMLLSVFTQMARMAELSEVNLVSYDEMSQLDAKLDEYAAVAELSLKQVTELSINKSESREMLRRAKALMKQLKAMTLDAAAVRLLTED